MSPGVGSFTPQMQEIDEITVRRARVVVDSRDACMAEAGDLIIAGAVISAEIGEIVNGVFPPRQNDQEITFFKTVGVAVQDAAAAAAVLAAAAEKGLGSRLSIYPEKPVLKRGSHENGYKLRYGGELWKLQDRR